MKKRTPPANPVETALAWVESIRHSEMGHSDNEKKLMALADEVKRLRRETKKPALRAVPSPVDVDDAAEAAMELIDKLGAPPLPRAAWISLLEEIIGQCRTRITAAREDEEHGRG